MADAGNLLRGSIRRAEDLAISPARIGLFSRARRDILALRKNEPRSEPTRSKASNDVSVAIKTQESNAWFELGERYYFGRSVRQDYRQAAEWFRKAADKGHAPAQNYLGWMLSKRLGVAIDYSRSNQWIAQGAGGDDFARVCARKVRNDEELASASQVVIDAVIWTWFVDSEAAVWYLRAARGGHLNSQVNIGVLNSRGQGVLRDDFVAAYWFQKAAEQGSIWGQINLGRQYAQGFGVPYDYREAAHWFKKAALQGSARARIFLRWLFEDGCMASEDDPEMFEMAYRHYPYGEWPTKKSEPRLIQPWRN